jgi:PPM family protein phosphatase
MKIITPDKVRTHSQRSILNKCVGFDLFIQPDVSKVALKHGDMIVLCSDGVWSVLDDHEFAEIAEHAGDPIGLARQTVKLALERDSDDNLSVVAIHAERLARVPVEANNQRNWSLPQIFKGRSTGKA